MRRRIFVLLCVVVLALAGCGNADSAGCTKDTVPEEEVPDHHCPWEYDVCARAVAEGKLHYYFMSSEGKISSGNELEPTKWGDSCLIAFPNGQTMLVDCGVEAYGPILVENLKRMGVKRIDYFVITHPHGDHQNGAFHPDNLTGEGLLDQFEIGTVYHRGGTDPSRDDDQYVETVCAERGLSLQVLKMGDTLEIGNVTVKVLWPKEGTAEKQITGTANVNNSSIVIRFDFGEHSSLFTGDLYDDGEFAMMSAMETMQFDVDLLKSPHHGGYTSSSDVFLTVTSPELAVATGYRPIRDDVGNRYTASNIPILDDYTYGYIHVATDGKEMTYETSRQEPLPIPTETTPTE